MYTNNDITCFFTAEDSREIPKGSRDPLRFIPEWADVGRRMIPWLTTVTPSYRGFLTRFLFHGALEQHFPGLARASIQDQWHAFCRFEQFCACVRTSSSGYETPWLPGSSGVPARVKDGRFYIGDRIDYWLGKSQQSTGFWGYYHQASRGSGLLEFNQANRPGYVLTEVAKQRFLSSEANVAVSSLPFEALFGKGANEFEVLQWEGLARYFAQKPYESELEMGAFWCERLLYPGTAGIGGGCAEQDIQIRFANQIKGLMADESELPLWERLAECDEPLIADHAKQVCASEAIIGLCEWVFDSCRMQSEEAASLDVSKNWATKNGYSEDWLLRLRALEEPQSPVLRELREIALNQHDSFKKLATALLDRHKTVMAQRNGAPWVTLVAGEGLLVREYAQDPGRQDHEGGSGIRWQYSYFLKSWVKVAQELGFIPEDEGDDN